MKFSEQETTAILCGLRLWQNALIGIAAGQLCNMNFGVEYAKVHSWLVTGETQLGPADIEGLIEQFEHYGIPGDPGEIIADVLRSLEDIEDNTAGSGDDEEEAFWIAGNISRAQYNDARELVGLKRLEVPKVTNEPERPDVTPLIIENAANIVARRFRATFVYPGCIQILWGDWRYMWGNVNEVWHADVYNDSVNPDAIFSTISSDLASSCTLPDEIALAINCRMILEDLS